MRDLSKGIWVHLKTHEEFAHVAAHGATEEKTAVHTVIGKFVGRLPYLVMDYSFVLPGRGTLAAREITPVQDVYRELHDAKKAVEAETNRAVSFVLGCL